VPRNPSNAYISRSLVIVHGLYGGSKENLEAGIHPGSGSSAWVKEYAESLETNSRILRYNYDATRLLVGVGTRDAIRQESRSLLGNIISLRNTTAKVWRLINNCGIQADVYVAVYRVHRA
jgi:hypothetical protein